MNRRWYQTTGLILILIGITSAFFVVYDNFNRIYPTELVIGIIFAVIILISLIIPGISLMNVKENKLTKACLILILIGFGIMILSFILALTQRGDPFGYGMALLGGLILAGSLYVIAIIILVVNKLKKRIIIK
jgi:hypothetical protein